MGLYKRFSGVYWMTYTVGGKPRYESTGTHNKKLAQKVLAIRQAEIAEGRWNLPASNPPRLKEWATQFLRSIQNPSTKIRYEFSVSELKTFFGEKTRLSDVSSVRRIEEFKQERLASGVKPATVNRDLSVLRRMLTLATRQRLIARNPFVEVELLEERKQRRRPHILTFDEQAKLLAAARPHLRLLVVLITETGLRVGKEALPLKWEHIDFTNDVVRVHDSKTLAGIREIPLSLFCKENLLRWRQFTGPVFSPYVFFNPEKPSTHLRAVRKVWTSALRNAKLPYFCLYDLRAVFASRLSAAGVPDVFVSQMMGHAGGLLQTYSKAIVEYRRDAIRKLEELRQMHADSSAARQTGNTIQ